MLSRFIINRSYLYNIQLKMTSGHWNFDAKKNASSKIKLATTHQYFVFLVGVVMYSKKLCLTSEKWNKMVMVTGQSNYIMKYYFKPCQLYL
jgi:hypothetical protein